MSGLKRAATGIAALALALTACTSGSDGPRTGGVAAQVGETTVSIGAVESMTDAYCMAVAAAGQVRPRSQAVQTIALVLSQEAILDELGLATGVRFNGDLGREIPGWEEMDAEQRAQLRTFIDVQVRMESALIALGAEGSGSPVEAMEIGDALLAERIEEELQITVNPRFDLQISDGTFVPATDLSIGVSDTAVAAADDVDHLRGLPASQVCGALPENPQL